MKLSNDCSKGMLKDFNNLKHDKDFYSFALNISPVDNIADRTTKQNEKLLKTYLSLDDGEYNIIGTQWLGGDDYLFFVLVNNISKIILVNNKQLFIKYENPLLNFKLTNVIRSTYRVNYKGERIVYFVDGLNDDRVINIDTINLNDSIETISMNPNYSTTSSFEAKVLSNGGSLKSGKYSIVISFKDKNLVSSLERIQLNNLFIEDGNYYENIIINNNLPTIEDKEIALTRSSDNSIKGLNSGSRTTKAINIKQLNTNLINYPFLDIYIIRKTSTDTEVLLLEDVNNKEEFTITGNENFQSLGSELSSVIIRNSNYTKSNVITQFNNRLIRANTSTSKHNQIYQDIANNIEVTYKVKKSIFNYGFDEGYDPLPLLTGNTKDFNSSFRNRIFSMNKYNSNPDYLSNKNNVDNKSTFLRDEVYALGVYFEMEDGSFTDVFHIPGRLNNNLNKLSYKDEYDRTLDNTTKTDWDTVILNESSESKPAWQLINTSTYNNDEGELGYYRTNYTYPDNYNFPTNGEKDSNNKSYIRHHRIPSEKLVPSVINGTLSNVPSNPNGLDILYRQDIVLDFKLPNIDPNINNKIKRVFFTSAIRNETNKKVLSHGLSYGTGYNTFNQIYRNNCDLNNPMHEFDFTSEKIQFISPDFDFKFKQSNVSGTFLKVNRLLKSRTLYLTKSRNGVTDNFGPLYGSTINMEGYNPNDGGSFTYKEEFLSNHSYYGNHYNVPFFKQFKILNSSFVDSNFQGSIGGSNFNLEGAQNSVIVSLTDPNGVYDYLGYKPSDFNNALNGGPFFELDNTHSSRNPAPDDSSNLRLETFYDSVFYCTMLTNNENIFYDILNLEYNTLYNININNINYEAYGDSYIENHISKKSFSKLFEPLSNFRVYGGKDTPLDTISNQATYDNLQVQFINNYIIFPVTTSLNIRLSKRDGDNSMDYLDFINKQFPVNEAEKRSRRVIKYELDPVYYNEDSITPMFQNTIKTSELLNTNYKLYNRIVYSELQNYESDIDNFRVTKVNNYKDLPSDKGFISHLFTKNGNLHAVTRDTIFQLFTGSSQLQVDSGEQISIGTGDFLGSTPVELVSIEGGHGGSSSKLGLLETPYGYIIIDSIRNKILLFDDNLTDINNFGLTEDFKNTLLSNLNEFDYPLLGQGILTGYDPKLHRLLITEHKYKPLEEITSNYEGEYNNQNLINNKYYFKEGQYYKAISNNLSPVDYNNKNLFHNCSKTVSFDLVNKSWLSYHDYFPKFYIKGTNDLLLKKEDILEYDNYNFNNKFIMELVFNEYQKDIKVFDSLEFNAVRHKEDNYFNKLVDSIIIYNDTQITGEILLEDIKNIKYLNGLYKFSNILDISKDIKPIKLFNNDWDSIKNNYYIDKVINNNSISLNKEWYKKSRIKGDFIKVRLLSNNEDTSKFILNYVNANIRKSYR